MLSNLSDQQREAVLAATRTNVVTAAGAGSGKTFMLVRLLSYLLSPAAPRTLDVTEIVAFTYTKKAALEMTERLRSHVSKLVKGPEGAHWRRVRDRLALLSIGTFHSFCQHLISLHPAEAGLDPAFTVIEPDTADLLLEEVVLQTVDRLLQEGLDDLLFSLGPSRLSEALVELVRELRLRGVTPDEAAAEVRASAPQPGAALEAFRAGAEGWLAAAAVKPTPALAQKVEAFAPRWAGLAPTLAAGSDSLLSSMAQLAAIPDLRSPALKPHVEAMRQAVADLADCQVTAHALALLELVRAVWTEYDARKGALGHLDYDDLVWKARSVLRHPHVRAEWSGRIQKLLVDEAQDSDALQWEVIRLLLDGGQDALPAGRLFVVGDKKQSIYRFRGAQVEVFEKVAEAVVAGGGQALPLQTNYRSRPAVIGFVNGLFAQLGLIQSAGDEMKAHRPTASGPAVEILLADQEGATRTDEAALIGDRIAALIDSGMLVTDPKTEEERPIRYGDVAILFRAMTQVDEYAQALALRGIPHYVVAGQGFWAQPAVLDLINLVQAVTSPTDGVSLLGALRGPAFSLQDDTLFILADGGRRPLWEGLAGAERLLGAGPERERAVRAARLLHELRQASLREPADRGLELSLQATGLRERWAAAPDAVQHLANLAKITRLASQGAHRDLGDLARWLLRQRDREVREGLAGLAAESDPTTVKLLTIHKAKGLEWPVVIVADSSRPANSDKRPVKYLPGKGVALRLYDPLGDAQDSSLWEAMKEREKEAESAESLRLFYVATTRAREYLILSGRPEAARGETWLKQVEFLWGEGGAPDWAGGPVLVQRRADVPVAVGGSLAPSPKSVTAGELIPAQLAPIPSFRPTDRVPASSSRLMDLQTCARRFYLKYILGMPEPKGGPAAWDLPLPEGESEPREWTDPLIRGELLHWICERLQSREQIPVLVAQGLAQFDLTGAADLAADATRMLEQLVSHPLFARIQAGQVESEVPFFLSLPSLELEGRIDALVREADGRYLIVDWKTNRTGPDVTATAVPYQLQLSVYALAVERGLGRQVGGAVLFFLDPGVAHEVELDLAAAEVELERLGGIIRAGATGIEAYPQEPSACGHCRYRVVCGTTG